MPDSSEPTFDGEPACDFIKDAFGLMPGQTPRYDMRDKRQQALRRIADWIRMAEHDAIREDPTRG